MRIFDEKVDISYEKTKAFYDQRATKYNKEHPYISIMCQDDHPEIAEERNRVETSKILPILSLTPTSRILDLGCGIGRWADAITEKIEYYLGCDFSEELIAIAKERNQKENYSFQAISAMDAALYCQDNGISPFSHVIISGMMIYLNDSDVGRVLSSLDILTQKNATVYIREPMGVTNRLTLKDFYSEELKHDYNTIYRTRDEYQSMIRTFAPHFEIYEHGPMFEDAALNNRKETAQFYFILKKSVG